jgi:hypothetical protein
MDSQMVTRKEWKEFRETGLLLFINQILHVFGWTIVFELEGEEVKAVYPARVKFRGFDAESVGESYKSITHHVRNNIEALQAEVEL